MFFRNYFIFDHELTVINEDFGVSVKGISGFAWKIGNSFVCLAVGTEFAVLVAPEAFSTCATEKRLFLSNKIIFNSREADISIGTDGVGTASMRAISAFISETK